MSSPGDDDPPAGRKVGGLKGATIYKNPSDHPGKYVVRVWVAHDGQFFPSDSALIFPLDDSEALGMVRDKLTRMGAVCFGRASQDDPSILETWM